MISYQCRYSSKSWMPAYVSPDRSALKVGVNDAHDGFMQFHWQQCIKFEVIKSPFSLCMVVSSSLVIMVVTLTYTQKKLSRQIHVMKSCY